MAWALFLLVLFAGFLFGLGWVRWRETRFLKKNAKETMGKELRMEIEKESLDASRRKAEFEKKLKKFGN